MTWVLAKPFVQGYTLIISDICVTIVNPQTGKKQYVDCLQKIHDIESTFGLQVGFAGNVKNAFDIIEDMRAFVTQYKTNNPNDYLEVMEFIRLWRVDVQTSSKLQFSSDGSDAVHMFVAGTTEYTGDAEGVDGFSNIYMVKSPDYRPMSIHVFQWHHIGSGSAVEICQQVVQELSDDWRFRIMAIDIPPKEHVAQLVPHISELLSKELSAKGISTHLTLGIGSHGATEFGLVAKDNGEGRPDFPKLCTDYDSLSKRLSSKTNSASIITA